MKLTELLLECDKFLSSKKTEKDIMEFNSVVLGIKVQEKIPLINKKMILNLISLGMSLAKDHLEDNEKADSVALRVELEKCFFLHCLLSYTDIERDLTYLEEKDYDAVLLSGLIDKIEEKCSKDYHELRSMYLEAENMSSLIKATIAFENLQQFDVSELETILSRIQGKMTEKELEAVKTIMEYNDPTLRKIKIALEEQVKEDVKKS